MEELAHIWMRRLSQIFQSEFAAYMKFFPYLLYMSIGMKIAIIDNTLQLL